MALTIHCSRILLLQFIAIAGTIATTSTTIMTTAAASEGAEQYTSNSAYSSTQQQLLDTISPPVDRYITGKSQNSTSSYVAHTDLSVLVNGDSSRDKRVYNVAPVEIKNDSPPVQSEVTAALSSVYGADGKLPVYDGGSFSTIPVVTTNTNKQEYEFTSGTINAVSATHTTSAVVEQVVVHRVPYGSLLFWIYVGIATVTTLLAGVASGLTVGLLSLDPIQLRVFGEHGNETERKSAKTVSKLVENHHQLLVTLLIANSLAMEALPIFLDRLMPSWAAVLVSVTCILFFGEVLPQAFCTGPHQLKIASAAAPFVRVLICALFWLSYPIAALLDKILARESDNYYSRPHLKTLIRMHLREPRTDLDDSAGPGRMKSNANAGDHRALLADEVVVIEGALDLATKKISQIMIPIEKVYMLEWDSLLTRSTLEEILRAGHSRVPVYRRNRNNVRGLLLVKTLILVNPSDDIKVKDLVYRRPLMFEAPQASAYAVLNEFQKGCSHIVFVTPQWKKYRSSVERGQDADCDNVIIGIATLEDIIEELIQEEIYDEFDKPNQQCYSGPLPAGGGSSFRMPSVSHDQAILHYPSFKTMKVSSASPLTHGEGGGHETRLAALYQRPCDSSGSTGVHLADGNLGTPTETRLRFTRRRIRRVSQGGATSGDRRVRSLQRNWLHSSSHAQSMGDGLGGGRGAIEYSVTASGDEADGYSEGFAGVGVSRSGVCSPSESYSDVSDAPGGSNSGHGVPMFRRVGSTVSDVGGLSSRDMKLSQRGGGGGSHTLSAAAAVLFGGIDPFSNPRTLNIGVESSAAVRVPLMENNDFQFSETPHKL